jgi:hypothetical protein
MQRFSIGIGLGLLLLIRTQTMTAADAPLWKLTEPRAFQVVQRDGYVGRFAHPHAVGGPQRGSAAVALKGQLPEGVQPQSWQVRWQTVVLPGAIGAPQPTGDPTPWQSISVVVDDQRQCSASVVLPAGGWYRVELQLTDSNLHQHTAIAEPVGVGDVFLIAGQSYAGGHNDELLRVKDPQQRVARCDFVSGEWAIAHDPQPHVGDGGTIWPPCGDWLAELLDVPIGLVNVSVGATAVGQWQPDGSLYPRLKQATGWVPQFRAVLWQQGESDVLARTSTAEYVRLMQQLQQQFDKDCGRPVTWLLAKSTLHPTVYVEPELEQQIRTAIDELTTQPGFRAGPDTDLLGGENRGPLGTRRHFSAVGQRRAALLWVMAIWNVLHDTNQTAVPASPDPADGPAKASSP